MKPIKRPSNLSGIRASMFTQRQEHTLFEQAKDYAFRYLDELNGKPAIRISVCSWATTASDVERSVATFIKCRAIVQSEMSIDLHSDN